MLDIKALLDLAVPILITLALLYFLYGLTNYILANDSEVDKEKGRNIMIYGIVALFVIVAVWGLVGVVARTFQIQGGSLGGDNVPLVGSPFQSGNGFAR